VASQYQIFKLEMSVVLSITGAPGSPNVQTPFLLGGPQFLAYAQDETPSMGLKRGLCRESELQLSTAQLKRRRAFEI
jgi:hypothetical protein